MKYKPDEIHFDWHCDNLPEGPYEKSPFDGLELPFGCDHIDPIDVGLTENMTHEPDIRWNE